MFMGFGYNPKLSAFGERLDILNFFYWMKLLQDGFSSTWVIYDASGYYIVNRTSAKNIEQLGKKPAAEKILDVLISEQDKPKRQDIMWNCELRSQYLRRAIQLCGIDADYIDSRQVFRESKPYETALDQALEYTERLQKDDPGLVAQIMPPNANSASRLYLPLEIAEALYLEQEFAARGKLGPKTEEFFDQAILGLTSQKQIPYTTIRCPFGPRKPGYLSDENVIWTSFPDTVPEILRLDSEYRNFVAQYLEPFMINGDPIGLLASRVAKQLALEEVLR